MSYTLHDKTMGTKKEVKEDFWGLMDIAHTHDYELTGTTELGVTVEWTYHYDRRAQTDLQSCRIKCDREGCESWMEIDPKYLDRVERFSCADCIIKYGYKCNEHGMVEDLRELDKIEYCPICAAEDAYIDYMATPQGMYEQYSNA